MKVYIVKNFMNDEVYLFSNSPSNEDISKVSRYSLEDVRSLLEAEEFGIEPYEVIMNEEK